MSRYNWEQIPLECKWVATDRLGVIWACETEPWRPSADTGWRCTGAMWNVGRLPDCVSSESWEQSVEERPAARHRYYMQHRPDEATRLYDDHKGRYLTWGQILAALNGEAPREC